MEGIDIKTFLKKIERTDRSLLKLLTHFRVDQRGNRILLITESPELKDKMELLLRERLGGNLRNVDILLEGEGEIKEEKSWRIEGLNSRFTFENFVVGEGNRLAYEVAREVAQNPGRLYNPLFIYGSVGLGKTPSPSGYRELLR